MKNGELKVTLDLRHEACGSVRAMMAFIKKVETNLDCKLVEQQPLKDSHELVFKKATR